MIRTFFFVCCPVFCFTGGGLTVTKAQSIVVAQDGSGRFRTVQEAINSLPAHTDKPREVFIKNGIYREKVYIDGKSNIVLRGESEAGVILTIAEARDIWRCDPIHTDDWGTATLNMRNSPDITLDNLTIINSYGFDATGDLTVDCPADTSKRKTVRRDGHQMAMRTLPGSIRIIVRNCTFRALGGDTVSPWDVDAGLYYFRNCTMEGGVDFYCPRGWAYAENCRFICHNLSAAIWHDGSNHEDSKTVLRNCTFTGDDGFKLGRYHRESQFYLIDCQFPQNMADADIYWAKSGPGTPKWGRRVYYFNCHRTGGDYAWHQNNLMMASNAPKPEQITANWTFGNRWHIQEESVSATDITQPNRSASEDAIAERMLAYQRNVGGWPKAIDIAGKEVKVIYDKPMTDSQLTAMRADSMLNKDATIDNDATTREINYLVKAYKRTQNLRYRRAAEKGIRYLLKAQYTNGGWPQYFPDTSGYYQQITYNDDAMIEVMKIMRNITTGKNDFEGIDSDLVEPAQQAMSRGIDCILKTQVKRNGKLTVWCAQHDKITLQPVKARKFELPSLSGMESVGIVEFLMGIDQPNAAVRQAIESAVAWFREAKLTGYAINLIEDKKQPTGKDRVITPDANSTIWARFYDLDTNLPFYVGRDSIKHKNLADIENERRAGYAYAGTWPTKLLHTEYPAWAKKWAK